MSFVIWRLCKARAVSANYALLRMRLTMARIYAVAATRRACDLDFSFDVAAQQTNPIGQRGHEGHIRLRVPQYWSIARDGITAAAKLVEFPIYIIDK